MGAGQWFLAVSDYLMSWDGAGLMPYFTSRRDIAILLKVSEESCYIHYGKHSERDGESLEQTPSRS